MVPFSSTSIAAGGYDVGSATLRLRYADGDIYEYMDVPGRVFAELLSAPSKGRFVNWRVKPYYAYVRIGRRRPLGPIKRRARAAAAEQLLKSAK